MISTFENAHSEHLASDHESSALAAVTARSLSISPPTGGVRATVACIRPDAKADPTPRGADNCCGLPGAAAKGVSPLWGATGLADSQSRCRAFLQMVRLRQCRAELSPVRTVRTTVRDSVTAIAPNEPCPRRTEFAEGLIAEAEDVAEARSIIANAPKPARPCPDGVPNRQKDPHIVRYAGTALSFEVHGGDLRAITVKDEEASVFDTPSLALHKAREVFGDLTHITIEPCTPPPPPPA